VTILLTNSVYCRKQLAIGNCCLGPQFLRTMIALRDELHNCDHI